MKKEEIREIENLKNKKDTYVIRWQVTSLCNYSCAFCVQGNKAIHAQNSKGESSKVRFKICEQLVQFIENELNGKYKKLRIFLIGGEVTILNDFKDLLKKLAYCRFDGDIRFQITTNLSLNKEELLEIVRIFEGNKSKKYTRILNISASFYKEFTTEKEFMEKIKWIRNRHKIKNKLIRRKNKYRKNTLKDKIMLHFIKRLEKTNRNIYLKISYPLVEDKDYEAYLQFKKRNKKYVDGIHYIVIRNYKKSISKDLITKIKSKQGKPIKLTKDSGDVLFFFRTADISLHMEDVFNPRGMLCDIGMHSISINNVGVVSRCVSCAKESIVGNLLKENMKLLEKEFICPNKSCSCDYYSTIKRN